MTKQMSRALEGLRQPLNRQHSFKIKAIKIRNIITAFHTVRNLKRELSAIVCGIKDTM